MNKGILIPCEICGKLCNELIGLSSHISHSRNHPTTKEYFNRYSIYKYTFKKLKIMFDESYKINDNTGCWLWTGCVGWDGYGELYAFNTLKPAHRFSYEIHKGHIPDGLCVCHTCDTPLCVNPEHLWIGTSEENTADSVRKGRRASGKRNGMAKAENREKVSKALRGKPRPKSIGNKNNKGFFGDKNPMKRPEVVKKNIEARKRNKLLKQKEGIKNE